MTDPLFADILGTGATLESAKEISPRKLRLDARRKMLRVHQHECISDVIDALPRPGEQMHVVSMSKFDFWRCVPHLQRLIGRPVALWCSTWTASRANVTELGEMLRAGEVTAAHILTGTYFKRRETAVYSALLETIQAHQGSRYVAFQNHAKVLLLDDGKTFLTVEGSANLTANPRLEQFVLTNDRTLHQFHRTWMEEAFSRTINDEGKRAAKTRKPGYSQRRAGLGVMSAHADIHARRAITAWKADPTEDKAKTLRYAEDVETVIREWIPHTNTAMVVTCPPAGASAGLPRYPARELAQAVAKLMGLQFRETVRRTDTKKYHGPAYALQQAPFECIGPPPKQTIVVDDLITSGATMRRTIEALTSRGASAWGFAYSGC